MGRHVFLCKFPVDAPKFQLLLVIYNFRQCTGSMEQVFTVWQVCEKYLANGKNGFWAHLDFEKAYDTMDRHGMWQIPRVLGVGEKLCKTVSDYIVSGRIGKVVASHAECCRVDSRQSVHRFMLCTKALRGYCP